MTEKDIFCQSVHSFVAGKELWLLQTHNNIQRADCWQVTDVIPDKNEATNEKGKIG